MKNKCLLFLASCRQALSNAVKVKGFPNHCSKAWVAAGVLLWPGVAFGQLVVTTGDVNPSPSTSPTWDVSTSLIVGNTGNGTLTISGGGRVFNTSAHIATTSTSKGTVTVEGKDSTWINSGGVSVGTYGTGELTISAGGTVSGTAGYIGDNFYSNGTVMVTGSGSAWTSTGSLDVGSYGAGKLTISAGGKVSNSTSYIAYSHGASGTVTVTGSDSTWASTNSVYVGFHGTGELMISGGGKVSNSYGYIGFQNKSVGSATVTGSQSIWVNADALRVGAKGEGTLRIENSGRVTATAIAIGDETGSEGKVTVTGANSTLGTTNGGSGAVYVGNNGAGELRIEDGGRVSNATGFVGTQDGATGTATVTGAGSLWENSGDLILAGNSTTGGTTGTGALTISDGGTVSVAGTTRVHTNGTVNLEASGTLQTRHLNATGGAFNFQGGTLIADGTITGDLAVPEFGALGGNATITGDLFVSGTLTPGNSTGTITVLGDLTLDSTAWTTLELASLTDFDRIAVNGGLTLGGTLMLDFIDGFTLDGTAEFTLFTGDYTWLSGTFASIGFSTSGYEGIFDYETGSLTINVIPEPSTYGLLIISSSALFALHRRRCRAA